VPPEDKNEKKDEDCGKNDDSSDGVTGVEALKRQKR